MVILRILKRREFSLVQDESPQPQEADMSMAMKFIVSGGLVEVDDDDPRK